MSRFDPWPAELDLLLKQNFNKSYEELEVLLGKSRRSIKHRIAKFGLRRDERRRWSEVELKVLRDNVGLTPRDFVELGLIDRSEVQIAIQLRKVRGTALRKFEISVCEDDAYLLGAICSDCLVDKRGLELVQSVKDEVFVRRVKLILENHGLNVRFHKYLKSLKDGSKREYLYLFASGKYILQHLATEDGLAVGNVRGSSSEWVEFIDSKFAWVWRPEYVWWFFGGLFDGDGTGTNNRISFAIKPVKSAQRVQEELFKQGFETSFDGVSVNVLGGEESFCKISGLLQNVISRKTDRSVQGALFPRKLADGVQAVPQYYVKNIFEREHYLGTIPGGSSCYAVVSSGEVVAAAAFKRVVEKKYSLVALELRRFVTSRHEPGFASKSLAAIFRVAKVDFPDCKVVVSFADRSQGHVGIIYKAVGGVLVGDTGPSIKIISDSGRSFGGRFLAQTLIAANVDVSKCSVQLVEGKSKYFIRLNMIPDEFKALFK